MLPSVHTSLVNARVGVRVHPATNACTAREFSSLRHYCIERASLLTRQVFPLLGVDARDDTDSSAPARENDLDGLKEVGLLLRACP